MYIFALYLLIHKLMKQTNLVLIYISTLEILPSSEGFLFNYTYL